MRGLSVSMMLCATGVAMAQERSHQLPTATEVFNLRSRCTALAEKMLEENVVSANLSQLQISRYDPKTNRCYVEVTVQHSTDPTYHNRYLYDGQTKELLAFSKTEKGRMSGMVFDRQHTTKNLDNAGWDDANKYMDQMMAEDRK